MREQKELTRTLHDWYHSPALPEGMEQAAGEREGEVVVTFKFPVAWMSLDGGRQDAQESHGFLHMRVTQDEGGHEQLSIEIPILRNIQELHAHAQSHYGGEDLEMFPYFKQWTDGYIQGLNAQGEHVSFGILDHLIDSLEYHGLAAPEESTSWRDWATLQYSMFSEEGDAREGHLAISWTMPRASLDDLYTLAQSLPDEWWHSCVGQKSWKGFFAYIVGQMTDSVARVYPYLVESAQTFATSEAPRLVWEAMQRVFAAGQEETDYLPMSVFGHRIEEHPWFEQYARDRIAEAFGNDRIISLLRQEGMLTKIRLAEPILFDEPLENLLTADVRTERDKKSIDILYDGNILYVEYKSRGGYIDTIRAHIDAFVNGWSAWRRDSGLGQITQVSNSYVDELMGKEPQPVCSVGLNARDVYQNPSLLTGALEEIKQFDEYWRTFLGA